MQETWVQSLGQEDLLEKEMATYSSILAREIPWRENLVGYSLPGSSDHRIFQARILEWVAISFFRGSSRPRDRTQVSCIAGSLPGSVPHTRMTRTLKLSAPAALTSSI